MTFLTCLVLTDHHNEHHCTRPGGGGVIVALGYNAQHFKDNQL